MESLNTPPSSGMRTAAIRPYQWCNLTLPDIKSSLVPGNEADSETTSRLHSNGKQAAEELIRDRPGIQPGPKALWINVGCITQGMFPIPYSLLPIPCF
jgi:hypothetical protein